MGVSLVRTSSHDSPLRQRGFQQGNAREIEAERKLEDVKSQEAHTFAQAQDCSHETERGS